MFAKDALIITNKVWGDTYVQLCLSVLHSIRADISKTISYFFVKLYTSLLFHGGIDPAEFQKIKIKIQNGRLELITIQCEY